MEEEIKEEPIKKDKEVIVIQYLHPTMSNELLCKFPDNSAFDFDYSQSSIWSPLVPRFHSLACLNPKSPALNRRLSFGNNNVSLSSKIKKKMCAFGLNLNAKLLKKMMMNKKRLKCSDEGCDNVTSPPSTKKGWKKTLKMTSKQFKRKKDPLPLPRHHRHGRVTLSDYLQSQDF